MTPEQVDAHLANVASCIHDCRTAGRPDDIAGQLDEVEGAAEALEEALETLRDMLGRDERP